MPTDPPAATSPAPPLLPSPLPTECAQFDFLIGNWDAEITRVGPDGRVLARLPGRWHAEHRHGGRVVLDEFATWTPDGSGLLALFVTLRTWCPADRHWEMTFLTAHQPTRLATFTGVRRGDEMLLEAVGEDGRGNPSHSRVRFHEIAPEGFCWEQRTTPDGGATWQTVARIRARRRPGRAPLRTA